jgi:hypothetical protein
MPIAPDIAMRKRGGQTTALFSKEAQRHFGSDLTAKPVDLGKHPVDFGKAE